MRIHKYQSWGNRDGLKVRDDMLSPNVKEALCFLALREGLDQRHYPSVYDYKDHLPALFVLSHQLKTPNQQEREIEIQPTPYSYELVYVT